MMHYTLIRLYRAFSNALRSMCNLSHDSKKRQTRETQRRVSSSTINCLTFIQQNEYFQCRHRHVHPRLLIDKTQINSSRFFCDFINRINNGRKAAILREFQKLSNATRYYETYCTYVSHSLIQVFTPIEMLFHEFIDDIRRLRGN